MKQKLSISVDEEVVKQIEKKIVEGLFRNRSHALEFAIKKLFRGEE